MRHATLAFLILFIAGCGTTSLRQETPRYTDDGWQILKEHPHKDITVEISLIKKQHLSYEVYHHIWKARINNQEPQAWCVKVQWLLVDIKNETITSDRTWVLVGRGKTAIGRLTEQFWKLENGYLPLQGYGMVSQIHSRIPIVHNDNTMNCEFRTQVDS